MKQKKLDLIINVAKEDRLNDGRKADWHCACVRMKDVKSKQGIREARTIDGVVFLLKWSKIPSQTNQPKRTKIFSILLRK